MASCCSCLFSKRKGSPCGIKTKNGNSVVAIGAQCCCGWWTCKFKTSGREKMTNGTKSMPWDRQRKLLILRSNVESSLPFENNKSIYLNKFNLLAFFVGSIRRISELYRSVLFAKWQLPDKESALESFFDLMAIALL